MAADPIEVALRVARALDEHDVRHLVGGSLASSISGEPRSTLDVDLVVALGEEQVARVVAESRSAYVQSPPEGQRGEAMNRKLGLYVFGLLSIAVSRESFAGAPPIKHATASAGVEPTSITLPDRECQGVPATGQTECSDQDGNAVDCEGTGQDGEFQKGLTTGPYPRFKDNGDGTVKDNLTGLIWLKNAICFGQQNWTNAMSLSNTLANGACGLTDASVAGDWRVPNVKELQSLIDYGNFFPALPTGHPFSALPSDIYWSSSSFVYAPYSAWGVFSGYGTVVNGFKSNTFQVWPVRGGQ